MNLVEEIAEELNNGNLSVEQVAIFNDISSGNRTYDQIKREYHISCNNVIIRILIRTIQLLFWGYGFLGGSDPYLCKRDLKYFGTTIYDFANDINCVTCSTAIQLAHDLKSSRKKKAKIYLHSIKKDNLIKHLKDSDPPSREYIYNIINGLDLKIVCAQSLEFGRRYFCDYNSIVYFFMFYGKLFQRDNRLIINMDETSLSSKKRLKVIAKKYQLPLLTQSPKIPHLTGCITVTGGGHFFKPLIVLPNKKTLRYLKEFEDQCYFMSTTSGWMTKKCFLYYTLLLISQISIYRLSLNSKIRNDSILLILDGHTSHISFLSAYLFHLFNIDLILIPPHTSHLLSVFDVSIASPLKTFFTHELNKLNFNPAESTQKNLTFFRTFIINSFLNAMTKSCTPSNIMAGFKKTGIFPLNPEIPLSSDFAMGDQNIYQNRAKNNLPTLFLNSELGLKHLFKEENNRDLTQDDLNNTLFQIFDLLTKNLEITSGIPLSKLPDILIDQGDTIKKLEVNVGK